MRYMLLNEMLSKSAARFPQKAAVVHHGRRLKYIELEKRSDIAAGILAREGVVKGDRVVLFLENSSEYVISYFGILKSGAAVVALSVQMVPREIITLIEDCTPKVIIADKKSAAVINRVQQAGKSNYKLLTVDDSTFMNDSAAERRTVPVSETELAAVIYTSGTTGKPKGVMLSHRNLASNAASIVQYLHISPDDSVMVILPFYYSYGHSLLTTHILAGATLVIDNRFLYPNTVLETMVSENVTGFAGVPSHFAILLRKSAMKSYKLKNLRYVTQAGGAMAPALIQEFVQALPHVKFFVMYGQTEASARLSYLEPDVLQKKMGSIGTAIPGVELAVVDEHGNNVKPGETGEITAKGENIMLGYWNAPEETNKVLRNGLLYTGDLARVDEDGYLYIISRKKDMIKSGANRVSPLEIEEVVCQLPGVIECAAVGIPDELLGEAIVLFVVPAEGTSLSDKEVLLHCKQNLAVYKMPKRVEFTVSLPKTASGKVKREELKNLCNRSS